MEHNIFNINNAGIWDYVRQLAAFNLIIFKIEQYAYKNTLTQIGFDFLFSNKFRI